jgi:hypothetical protein
MKRSPLWKHNRRNLQTYSPNQLPRFRVKNCTTRRASHEHHEGRLAARLGEFRRSANRIQVKRTGTARDKK